MRKLPFLIFVLLLGFTTAYAQTPIDWYLTGSTVKITSQAPLPADTVLPLQLHSARQEYAPFQIVIAAPEANTTVAAPQVAYPSEYFELQLFEEFFIDIRSQPDEVDIFSLLRLPAGIAVPDGLRPLGDTLDVPGGRPAVIWADLYVRADTPPGDYTITVTLPGAGERTVTVTVYPVDILSSAAMSIIIPVDAEWTMPFYASDGDALAFQHRVNQLLLAHNISLGGLTGAAELTDAGWDFSMFDDELLAIPPGVNFYVPNPYSNVEEAYLFPDQNGDPYTVTDFNDSYFVEQLVRYYAELADHLRALDRLAGALAYPYDETRWVADEPDHNGPEGYVHLSRWTAIIRQAGLRVTASRVGPAPTYSADWLPSDVLTDDSHVHMDQFDGGWPESYTQWLSVPGHSASVYLNHYGDLIDMPATSHRGMAWHVYARGSRLIAGYNAMEWVNAGWDLIDPWQEQDAIAPKFGYGVGALVYPGPLPSLRIKVLRESVEDARLLDLYAAAQGVDSARAFAACLTPGAYADQNPLPDLWDRAHAALLVALRDGTPVDQSICVQPVAFQPDQQVIADFDTRATAGDWSFDIVEAETLPSPWPDSGTALQLYFVEGDSSANLWLGGVDWRDWDVLLVDIRNDSPTFVEFDIALGDDDDYLLLRNGANILGPGRQTTLLLPLVVPYAYSDMNFDWSAVNYIDLQADPTITREDGFDQEQFYQLSPQTIVLDNFRLARYAP
ncbi:MAG: DUF4091 domain-containing protein [Chloroflexi bacterium]|nr:DUF4091 domain-containing protein [Chloroflexota bacterium]